MSKIRIPLLEGYEFDTDEPSSVACALRMLSDKVARSSKEVSKFYLEASLLICALSNEKVELKIKGLAFEDVVQILVSNGYDVTARFSGDQSFNTANDRVCTITYSKPEIPFE